MSESTGLAKYDSMCRAIAECHAADEAKHLRDQARALEVLSKQARNIEAERQAAEIRIRAERRWGEMYRRQEKANNRGANQHQLRSNGATEAPTLEDLGVSKSQSSQWQRLAEASDKDFEQALSKAGSVSVPTTSGVARNLGATVVHEEPTADPKAAAALWIWGRVNQFAETIRDLTPKQCASRCDEVMRGDLKAALPRLSKWLKELERSL